MKKKKENNNNDKNEDFKKIEQKKCSKNEKTLNSLNNTQICSRKRKTTIKHK